MHDLIDQRLAQRHGQIPLVPNSTGIWARCHVKLIARTISTFELATPYANSLPYQLNAVPSMTMAENVTQTTPSDKGNWERKFPLRERSRRWGDRGPAGEA